MRKLLTLAAVLSTVAFGAAQAQNYTIPAGDAGFDRVHQQAFVVPSAASNVQALSTGHSIHRQVIRTGRHAH